MHGTTAYDPAISSNVLIQMQPVQYILQVRFNTDTMSDWDWTTALLMTNTAAGSPLKSQTPVLPSSSFLLIGLKAGYDGCNPPLKTTEEDKEKIQEATVSLAAAETVLSHLDGIFTWTEVFPRWKRWGFFLFTFHWHWQEFSSTFWHIAAHGDAASWINWQ